MIQYLIGNIFESKADALVNTVNTVGVMGKGLALQYKKAFPHNYKVYSKACKDGEIQIGKLLVVKDQKKFILKSQIPFYLLGTFEKYKVSGFLIRKD